MIMVGHLSCATASKMAVAQAADAAVMGCPMHPEMKMLAEIGTKGKFKQNLWRDLENKLRLEECNFAEPLYVPMPLLDSRLAFAWADFSSVRGGPCKLQIQIALRQLYFLGRCLCVRRILFWLRVATVWSP